MNTKPSKTPLISCSSLRKTFGSKKQKIVALDDISISLSGGGLTLLMGPSGSGKSSMISCLGGLQKPDGGHVYAFGEDLWSRRPRKINKFRREHCGFVFQSVGLFPALSAIEQIMLPLKYLGWNKKAARISAQNALEEVGLGDRQFSRPSEMSGGQNQRVAIARMLAKTPQLIFCDEPTSALDGENGKRIAELLKEAARKHNAMVMCVTHDERLLPYADRVIQIDDGVVISDTESGISV
ncbi:MAG: ABC transporter ATP-binding protein [Robiginitomaculum sp.]|nr:MAG: ABC transporter ATP-binding protein [Robiginitomaculum sp.]